MHSHADGLKKWLKQSSARSRTATWLLRVEQLDSPTFAIWLKSFRGGVSRASHAQLASRENYRCFSSTNLKCNSKPHEVEHFRHLSRAAWFVYFTNIISILQTSRRAEDQRGTRWSLSRRKNYTCSFYRAFNIKQFYLHDSFPNNKKKPQHTKHGELCYLALPFPHHVRPNTHVLPGVTLPRVGDHQLPASGLRMEKKKKISYLLKRSTLCLLLSIHLFEL